jgi:hypothetical protein
MSMIESQRNTFVPNMTLYVFGEFVRVLGNDIIFSIVGLTYFATMFSPQMWEVFGWVTYGASIAYFGRILIVILTKIGSLVWLAGKDAEKGLYGDDNAASYYGGNSFVFSVSEGDQIEDYVVDDDDS